MVGGYDEGYAACPCFWGANPGSLVEALSEITDRRFLCVLDAGCGEGKNAAHYAALGAQVRALDISTLAISNGRRKWQSELIQWEVGDIQEIDLPIRTYDLTIAYGLLHCLSSPEAMASTCEKLIAATQHAGYLLVCLFNDRKQELTAHPGFRPTLLSHVRIKDMFAVTDILFESDEDLLETHPHNMIEHSHSLTRLIARVNHD